MTSRATVSSNESGLAKQKIGARILVVDDMPVNQIIAAGFVEKFGHVAVVVNDGLEALDALAKEDYDLVLMDCQMPRMDGFQATQIIRQTGPNAHIPIIA